MPFLAQDARSRENPATLVILTLRYAIAASPGCEAVELGVLLPRTITGRQKILDIHYSHAPFNTFVYDGLPYAHFVLQTPPKATEIVITVAAEVYRFDLGTARTDTKCRHWTIKRDLKRFIAAEEYLESDAPLIREVAATLRGDSEIETVAKTMAYVTSNLAKGPFDSADHGALWVLEKKEGDCTEFADLFIALCRANGLPARFCQGYLIHEVADGDTPKHDWAEVYLEDYGWVPFDPLHVYQGSATLERLQPIYIYLDSQRQNSLFDNGHYYAYRYRGEPAAISDSFHFLSGQPVHKSTGLAVTAIGTK
jgi:transglutaminase-like putative cysteine protease